MFIASAAIKIDLQKQERLHLLNLQHAKNVWLYGTVPFCSNIPGVSFNQSSIIHSLVPVYSI